MFSFYCHLHNFLSLCGILSRCDSQQILKPVFPHFFLVLCYELSTKHDILTSYSM
ncbi:hypothetical protein M758_7G103700 [Ceratodon purpureus]|nr:hypothetical protein M758_7G103700 [Ceratodon purpureus]